MAEHNKGLFYKSLMLRSLHRPTGTIGTVKTTRSSTGLASAVSHPLNWVRLLRSQSTGVTSHKPSLHWAPGKDHNNHPSILSCPKYLQCSRDPHAQLACFCLPTSYTYRMNAFLPHFLVTWFDLMVPKQFMPSQPLGDGHAQGAYSPDQSHLRDCQQQHMVMKNSVKAF